MTARPRDSWVFLRDTPVRRLCARADYRERAVAGLVDLAERMGATVRTDRISITPRALHVSMGRDGYAVSISIDGTSRVDVLLAHWHTAGGSDVKYPADFPADSVNRYHFGKATSHAHSLRDLLEKLEQGFRRVCPEIGRPESGQNAS